MQHINKERLKIIQLTPGAGGMYCGNCLRDNALVAEWNRMGHDVCMVPLYLPLTLDEPDQSENVPVFFGGINVFMSHKIPRLWRFVPQKVRRWLDSRRLLKSIGQRVSKTNPAEVGALTVSMLKGEEGHQQRELHELADWIYKEQPDVISFSNALLLGMNQHIQKATGAKTVCFLTGEDTFLDDLPEPHRSLAWNLVREHVKQIDVLIAPSRYFAELMSERLNLPKERIHVVLNGINTEGYEETAVANKEKLVLGYFARMCAAKGLDVLIEAFIEVRKRGKVPNLQLKIGGNLNPWNVEWVELLKRRLLTEGLLQDVSFHPNVSRDDKIRFLQSIDIFSVPAVSDEPFGFYVVEALVAGVPVVLPAKSAFPELVERSGGGVLYPPNDRLVLAEALESLCADESKRQHLSRTGKENALKFFSIQRAAKESMNLIFGLFP
ncbi:MAG: glycosyltransferase family 4 protein [Planctomycetaceae bacterium]|jgi:glycosyltransferase involved in cell wall biosynthesis|nr:glycosyltransferase family 4 protein [Planctomycetaceae bacterium]